MNIESLDKKTIEAIKKLITGLTTTEEVNEYQLDEEKGKMILVKQKIKTNQLPPNIDIIKLLFNKQAGEEDYSNYTEEELLKEKEILINQLKEEEDAS